MNAFKMIAVLVCFSLGVSACKGVDAGIDNRDDTDVRLEVYYRDFDKLWPIDYSEEDLIRSPTIRRVYTKARDVQELKRLLEEGECANFSSNANVDIDAYLLVREISAGEISRKWVGTKFEMVVIPTGRVCKITRDQRTSIDSFLRKQVSPEQ